MSGFVSHMGWNGVEQVTQNEMLSCLKKIKVMYVWIHQKQIIYIYIQLA